MADAPINYLDKEGAQALVDSISSRVLKTADLATVATSGSYNDLSDTPTVDTSLNSSSTRALANSAICTALKGYLPFDDTYCTDCNKFYVNGYIKTGKGKTTNLPSLCTGNDQWGILFFIAENATNGTGTQMYFPIDGTYVGRVFTRSLKNMKLSTTSPGTWQLLALNTEIPSKVSELTNDAGYITSASLVNYYLKTETYSQSEINDLISAIPKFTISVVDSLPAENISDTTVYLVTSGASSTSNLYEEYIHVNGEWEKLGSQSVDIDLSGYAKKTDIPTVPTNVSAFTNDAGYLTSHQDISSKADTSDLSAVAFSGDYNDLSNKPTIDSSVDSGVVSIYSATINYYNYKTKKTECFLTSGTVNDFKDGDLLLVSVGNDFSLCNFNFIVYDPRPENSDISTNSVEFPVIFNEDTLDGTKWVPQMVIEGCTCCLFRISISSMNDFRALFFMSTSNIGMKVSIASISDGILTMEGGILPSRYSLVYATCSNTSGKVGNSVRLNTDYECMIVSHTNEEQISEDTIPNNSVALLYFRYSDFVYLGTLSQGSDSISGESGMEIYTGTCSTAATERTKVITLNDGVTLKDNDLVSVYFSVTNSYSFTSTNYPIFKIGDDEYKLYQYENTVATGTTSSLFGYKNRSIIYRVDVTNKKLFFFAKTWDDNSTYSVGKLGGGWSTNTEASTVTARVISSPTDYALTIGGLITIKFSNAITAGTTLNVNKKGAKSIYYRGSAITDGIINDGDIATFVYDGTNYELININNVSDGGNSSSSSNHEVIFEGDERVSGSFMTIDPLELTKSYSNFDILDIYIKYEYITDTSNPVITLDTISIPVDSLKDTYHIILSEREDGRTLADLTTEEISSTSMIDILERGEFLYGEVLIMLCRVDLAYEKVFVMVEVKSIDEDGNADYFNAQAYKIVGRYY